MVVPITIANTRELYIILILLAVFATGDSRALLPDTPGRVERAT